MSPLLPTYTRSMAKRMMKLQELQSYLQGVEDFQNPKNEMEQYMTSPQQAAATLLAIESQYRDVIGKSVADLGCGTGMLGIGAAILGADYVLGVEKDEDAIEMCQQNLDDIEIPHVDLICLDVVLLNNMLKSIEHANPKLDSIIGCGLYKKFDTVIMNPPFGTKDESHNIDMLFLETAVLLSNCAVYSFHKSSTRKYIVEKKAKELNVKAEVLESFKFKLPKTYKFHKKKVDCVEVDFIRFSMK